MKYPANLVGRTILSCIDCGFDTQQGVGSEWYMVWPDIWESAFEHDTGVELDYKGRPMGLLCVGCLEDRIGRELTPGDFTLCPLNMDLERFIRSNRLMNRLGYI